MNRLNWSTTLSLMGLNRFLLPLLALSFLGYNSGAASEAEDKGAAYEFQRTEFRFDGNRFIRTVHARLKILNARGDEYRAEDDDGQAGQNQVDDALQPAPHAAERIRCNRPRVGPE